MDQSLKKQIHAACLNALDEKIAMLNQAIQDARETAEDDDKSSAGDKFETTREMMKLEIDKLSDQLAKAGDQRGYLVRLDPTKPRDTVGFGSLVQTRDGFYYFSIGLGRVELGEEKVYALSMASPIGRALEGKKAGDLVTFMERVIRIEKVE